LESLGIGLCTAAFLSFLMRICDKDQAATQYALLTALYGLTRFLGGFSGAAAERLGYAAFFAFTFLLCGPAYLFLPWVKRWVERGGSDSGALPGDATNRFQPDGPRQDDQPAVRSVQVTSQ